MPAVNLAPMEALSQPDLPSGPGWWFEPKWDGFRCIARSGRKTELIAKSGKPLTRYFPEIVAALDALHCGPFILDGELLIEQDGAYSFEALQARLHPAESRITKLARETPAVLMLFDLLADKRDLRALPHAERRTRLAALLKSCPDPHLLLTPGTKDRRSARRWLSGAYEGVIAKRDDGPYLNGERAMVKVKRIRTADCVVGGFRYATGSKLIGSLLLGLYDEDGLLHHVGFTSGFAGFDRAELTKTVEKLAGGPGFTGRAPGGPSRWSTERSAQWTPIQSRLVVEVSFDHVTNQRFRHGTRLLRLRPDKSPKQCGMEQIA